MKTKSDQKIYRGRGREESGREESGREGETRVRVRVRVRTERGCVLGLFGV
jgi:hypothetical protein